METLLMMATGFPRALALLLIDLTLASASANAAYPLTEGQARATIAPFYRALNATAGDEVRALVVQATSADWVSCSGNDTCRPRDQVIGGIASLHQAIPDLNWEIKEVLVAGDRAIVRGEASGTPSGEFMGVSHAGKAFKVMSIDVHTIAGGKMVRSYHVEDWIGATRQLGAK
jgi:predicted ester cyclase